MANWIGQIFSNKNWDKEFQVCIWLWKIYDYDTFKYTKMYMNTFTFFYGFKLLVKSYIFFYKNVISHIFNIYDIYKYVYSLIEIFLKFYRQ